MTMIILIVNFYCIVSTSFICYYLKNHQEDYHENYFNFNFNFNNFILFFYVFFFFLLLL